MLRVAAVVGGTTVALAIGPSDAFAATACEVGGAAVFAAADVVSSSGCQGTDGVGEMNSLKVDLNANGDVVLTDSQPITDGDGPGGCSVSGNTATCPGATG